ncbi:putative zinc-binding metallopeptidase [Sulfitobacter sp. LCG007]
MKRFHCPNCSNEVHFDTHTCVRCGQSQGYAPEAMDMQLLRDDGTGPRRCLNADGAGCNWLVPEGDTSALCAACKHNNVVPDPSFSGNRQRWAEIELAKRRLIYALDRWALPHPTREDNAGLALAFDFLAEIPEPDGRTETVLTGHADGLITVNIAEGDDVIRTERQSAMDESYRTLIGHMRHEVGHYYWQTLVGPSPALDEFRKLFGDERADYAQALKTHYETGAPDGWQDAYISAYATTHPWEDFAETWSHWMHIVDGLESAAAYGLAPLDDDGKPSGLAGDPYAVRDIGPVIEAWVPLTVAVNNLNRGMGQPDLYPFVLSRPVEEKLDFINRLIHGAAAGRG